MPFIGAPFGDGWPVGAGPNRVTFFFPIAYRTLTFEPSLLSGPVTVVGKIVAFAIERNRAYIDYPTISEFGAALLRQSYRFDNALGVCATAPPAAVLSRPTKRTVTHTAKPSAAQGPTTCDSRPSVLTAIKRSVTLPAPYVVVLPLAIYQ
jgi:hypothetical protein